MNLIDNVKDFALAVIEFNLSPFYFVRDLLFPPPETTTQEEPFEPPFLGGQCDGEYAVLADVLGFQGQVLSAQGGTSLQLRGKITALFLSDNDTIVTLSNNRGQTQSRFVGDVITSGAKFRSPTLLYVSGEDNCGNIPNPNPPSSIPNGGIPNSNPPNIANDGEVIVEGIVPAAAKGALATALELARNAVDALIAIQAVADAIEALKDLLQNKDDKDDKKSIEVIQYDFGLLSRDGFLRLYPTDNSQNFQAIYLDLQIRNIPIGYGRLFGEFSPNRFVFRSLGRIAFVSPTFGVISTEEIQYSRVSFGVPSGAIGFYYHLGLDGVIKANATGFYEKQLEDDSE